MMIMMMIRMMILKIMMTIRMRIISGPRLMVLLHSVADKSPLADEHCGHFPIKTAPVTFPDNEKYDDHDDGDDDLQNCVHCGVHRGLN